MFPFSRLQKALLAVGSFSCLGLNSGVETDVVKNDAYELKVSCTKFNLCLPEVLFIKINIFISIKLNNLEN